MTLGPKTKIAVGVAAVLGVAALGLMMLANRSQPAQDSSGDGGGAFPNILFSGAANPSQIAPMGLGSTMSDATTGGTAAPDSSGAIAAALTAAQFQITANTSAGYNTNATELFRSLPAALSSAGLTDFTASQSQDASGKTSLSTSVNYKAPVAMPIVGAPLPGADSSRWSDSSYRDAFMRFETAHVAQYGVQVPGSADPGVVAARVAAFM